MTRDDIIRWACEAYGVEENIKPLHGSCIPPLEHFARLVAAAEREACAKVCEEMDDGWDDKHALSFAEAIRDRGMT